MSEVRGYKVFRPDWTCRGFQYEVGKVFEEDVKPVCCYRGFHFCKDLKDCFSYYDFNPNNKVAEVIAEGIVNEENEDSKCCTNKIRIVREITWEEVLRMINTGKGCTGFCNTGNCNTGNRNTGDWNTGNCNTGNRNTGDWNTGNCNTGNYNTGNRNTGDWNTGDWNTGDWNTGDWNTGNRNTGDWNNTNFSTGCFNTEKQKIMLFNKPSDWTYIDWLNSEAHYLLNCIPKNVVEWICSEDMTDDEKEANPTYTTTGGYLKVLDESECAQSWWDELSEKGKNIIKQIPNFDKKIFAEITGIEIL